MSPYNPTRRRKPPVTLVRNRLLLLLWLPLLPLSNMSTVHAEETAPALHKKIDRLLQQASVGPQALLANDSEFHRRAHLNLVGRAPTLAETEAFLADDDEAKRAKLVDRLIASSEFDRWLSTSLDIMWMERRADRKKRVADEAWKAFLMKQVSARQPLDEMVRTILAADGTGEDRGAAKFLLEREVEPHALTRDVGRIFLGRDLQCAQCHDHPIIGDYYQAEYYGLHAFVNRSYLWEDTNDNNKAYVGEKAEGGTEFKSVFAPDDDPSSTIPRLLGGLSLEVEPRLEGETQYVVKPSKAAAGIPRYSRRAELGRLLTHPGNRQFARNLANRLWAHMMGQGLVSPVDFDHSDNPPSHPELLQLLTDALVDLEFQPRPFLREIALSSVYQRSVDFPVIDATDVEELTALERQLDERTSEIEAELEAIKPLIRRRWKATARWRADLAQIDGEVNDVVKRIGQRAGQQTKLREAAGKISKKLKETSQQADAVKKAREAAATAASALPKDDDLKLVLKKLDDRLKGLNAAVAKVETEQKVNGEQVAEVDAELQQLRAQLDRLKLRRLSAADMVAEARGAQRWIERRQQRCSAQLEACQIRKQNQSLQVQHQHAIGELTKLKSQQHEIARRRNGVAGELTQFNSQIQALETERRTLQTEAILAAKIDSVQTSTHQIASQLAARFAASVEQSRNAISNGYVWGDNASTATLNVSATAGELSETPATLPDNGEVAEADEEDVSPTSDSNEVEVLDGDDQESGQQTDKAIVIEVSAIELLEELNHQQQALGHLVLRLESEMTSASARRSSRTATVQSLDEQLAALTAQREERRQELEALDAKMALVSEQCQTIELEVAQLTDQVRDGLERDLAVRRLIGLTPEQMAGSVIASLQLDQRFQKEAEAEWHKKNKDQTGGIDEQRKRDEISALVQSRRDSVVSSFVSLFAAPAGAPQDVFSATADQALFVSNDGRVRSWLSPASGTLLAELGELKDDVEVARRLYLAILARPATSEEQAQVVAYLGNREKDRTKALMDIAWGLMSSLEFRFNH